MWKHLSLSNSLSDITWEWQASVDLTHAKSEQTKLLIYTVPDSRGYEELVGKK
jgi:hypothetical protein